ncbi:MAG: NTP transferase domain-containing protein [Saccharofermentans sp.]|nr:NTP transferase domain-containing protein [Saccharofermentans sp.]
MASGLGTRFGGNKLMADFGGKPMVQWIINLASIMFSEVVVVTRNSGVKQLCDELNIKSVFHTLPHRSDTVRIGLENISSNVDGCLFCLADQPLLTYGTLYNLVSNASANPECIWRPSCDGNVSSPIWFPCSLFSELSSLPEGKGGNVVAKRHEDIVRTISVANPIELQDIDTKDAYDTLLPYILPSKVLSDYQASGKKHLLFTGKRGSGKTTTLRKIISLIGGENLPAITSWAVPGKAVYLNYNLTNITYTIGEFDPVFFEKNHIMVPVMKELEKVASEVLSSMADEDSSTVVIDEIGYLESSCEIYSESLDKIIGQKRLIASVRKQDLPILRKVITNPDAYVVDMDELTHLRF